MVAATTAHGFAASSGIAAACGVAGAHASAAAPQLIDSPEPMASSRSPKSSPRSWRRGRRSPSPRHSPWRRRDPSGSLRQRGLGFRFSGSVAGHGPTFEVPARVGASKVGYRASIGARSIEQVRADPTSGVPWRAPKVGISCRAAIPHLRRSIEVFEEVDWRVAQERLDAWGDGSEGPESVARTGSGPVPAPHTNQLRHQLACKACEDGARLHRSARSQGEWPSEALMSTHAEARATQHCWQRPASAGRASRATHAARNVCGRDKAILGGGPSETIKTRRSHRAGRLARTPWVRAGGQLSGLFV